MAKSIKDLSEMILGLQNTILAFQEKITGEMTLLRGEVSKIGAELANIKQTATSAKELAEANEQKISSLTRQINDLSDRNRRANLIISGISEEVPANKLEETLLQWLQTNEVVVKAEDVERVHRLQRNGRGGAPRDVIIKFAREKMQHQIYTTLKKKKELTFRGRKVWPRQDFCQETLRKKALMRPFAQKLHANNVKFSWGYPSSIMIFREGKRLMARNTTEAKELLKQLGINTDDMGEQEMEEESGVPDDGDEGTSERREKRLRTSSR